MLVATDHSLGLDLRLVTLIQAHDLQQIAEPASVRRVQVLATENLNV